MLRTLGTIPLNTHHNAFTQPQSHTQWPSSPLFLPCDGLLGESPLSTPRRHASPAGAGEAWCIFAGMTSLIWPRKPISVGIFYVDIDWEKVPVSAAEVKPAEEAKGKKNRKSKGKKGKSGKGGKQKRR